MDGKRFRQPLPAPSNEHQATTFDRDVVPTPWDRGWTRATISGKSGVSEDWLVPLLLVCMQEGNSSGIRIKARVEELGFGIPRPGTVIRMLQAMEKEGLVVSNHGEAVVLLSRWSFEPTEAGIAYLEFWNDSLTQYRYDIERFLQISERLNNTSSSYEPLELSHGGPRREEPDGH